MKRQCSVEPTTGNKKLSKDFGLASKKHTGVTSGLPIKDIIDQSKVKTLMPKPDAVPNKEFTTTLFGAIQHIQLNMLNPVKRYPGTRHQVKLLQASAMKKKLKRSRLICLSVLT